MEVEKRVSARKRKLNNGADSYAEDCVNTEASTEEHAPDEGDEVENEYTSQKLKELENTAEEIEQGTYSEFIKDCQRFKKVRNRKLKAAEMCRSLQMKNIKDLYDFEIQAADHNFQHQKEALKERMLLTLNQRLAHLKHELELMDSNEDALTTTKIPTKPALAVANDDVVGKIDKFRSKLLEAWKEREKVIPFPPLSSGVLSPDEILRDLRAVYSDWKAYALRIESTTSVAITVKKGQLIYNHISFEVGDSVLIKSNYIDEEYIGMMTSITEDALYVSLIDGTDARVPVSMLRHKRCSIHPYYQEPSRVTTGVIKRDLVNVRSTNNPVS